MLALRSAVSDSLLRHWTLGTARIGWKCHSLLHNGPWHFTHSNYFTLLFVFSDPTSTNRRVPNHRTDLQLRTTFELNWTVSPIEKEIQFTIKRRAKLGSYTNPKHNVNICHFPRFILEKKTNKILQTRNLARAYKGTNKNKRGKRY